MVLASSRSISVVAEIEGSCDEVQPVAKILFPYTFQRLLSTFPFWRETAEIEGSCDEVQPVAKTLSVQSIQRFYFQSLAIAKT